MKLCFLLLGYVIIMLELCTELLITLLANNVLNFIMQYIRLCVCVAMYLLLKLLMTTHVK